jgi:hypothetical protein
MSLRFVQWWLAMNRRADATARVPGLPGPRGGSSGDHATSLDSHRPVKAVRTTAGAATAAPSNSGGQGCAAGVVPASGLATVLRELDPALVRAPQERALDLHKGISDPLTVSGRCKRWPEHFRMLNTTTGELVLGRCRATNLCPYCARLFAVETSEMLLLDAMEDAPTIYLVLTAREHLTRAECYSHLQQLRRSLKKGWPDVRWALLVEFQKRGALHLNLLLKGVPVDEVESLHKSAARLWCSRVDATESAQWAGVIADELGVVKYVTLHFMKQSQAPAIGWRGHRYSSTRDYLVRPASVMRREARESLRSKRLLWKIAGQVPGIDATTLEDLAAVELAASEAVEWKLWRDPGKPVPGHRRWRDTGTVIVKEQPTH